MLTLGAVRSQVSGYLEFRAIEKHRSRLGRHLAPRYTKYLRRCQRRYEANALIEGDIAHSVCEFGRKGFTSLWSLESQRLAQAVLGRIRSEEARELDVWTPEGRYRCDLYTTFPGFEDLFRGPLGLFLTAIYRAHFKIFFGVLYKSERLFDTPTGSQLWHTDGGPGTCINVMFYLSDTTKESGAMECLPWDASLEIYRAEFRSHEIQQRIRVPRKAGQQERDVRCEFYRQQISESYHHRVEQPHGESGLLVPFRNNILHKGGYPEPGHTRYACVFHCYPSMTPTPFERYRRLGIPKAGSFPIDPAADF